MYQSDALQVDRDELKRYLAACDVVEGELKIYQDMLGLTFEITAGNLKVMHQMSKRKMTIIIIMR